MHYADHSGVVVKVHYADHSGVVGKVQYINSIELQ